LFIDSREVADMVEKRHSDLLRDIGTYIQYMENAKLRDGLKSGVLEFFIEGSYTMEEGGRSYRKYDCTKKGCEFIAHKLTGQKGAVFTAKYINRFHEMEQALTSKPMPLDLIIATAQHLKALEVKQIEHDFKLLELKDEQGIIKNEQRILKGKVDILNDKEFTVMGYGNMNNMHLNNQTAQYLGRKASKLSKDKGYKIGSASHPVYGRVNTYHEDVLDEVFEAFC
jgi:Rha family phage regulatory protein